MAIIKNLKVYTKELYSTDEKNTKVLEGDYAGRHFVILRHHTGTPNAYLEILPSDHLMRVEPSEYGKRYGFDDRYDSLSLYVNGGATYFGDAYWDQEDKRTYIGWDYAHAYDYDPHYLNNDNNHKWAAIEIMMDIAHAYEGIMRDNDEHWEEMHKEDKGT